MIRKSIVIFVLAFSFFQSHAQNGFSLKLGYSFAYKKTEWTQVYPTNKQYIREDYYPYGGMFNISYTYRKISFSTGLEVNEQEWKTTYGFHDTLPSAIAPNTHYRGPTIIDNKFAIYTFPFYIGYTVFSNSKFKILTDLGYQIVFPFNYFKGHPGEYGDNREGYYSEYTNHTISADVEIQYKLSNNVSAFFKQQISSPLGDRFFYTKLGVQYSFIKK